METINHECYVSLEVAKLLKEVGFDWGSRDYYYDCSGEGEFRFYNTQSNHIIDWNHWPCRERNISAPTLEVAQRWLREEKELNVNVDTWPAALWRWVVWKINPERKIVASEHSNYKTYEEAQEAGIKKVLEIILGKGE